MNFQAVSVGQKLSKTTPTAVASRIQHLPGKPADTRMGRELQPPFSPSPAENRRCSRQHDQGSQGSRHLRLHPVHRKRQAWAVAHQSAKVNKPGHFADLVAALPDAATNAGAIAIAIANANACSPPAQQACGFVQDDDIAPDLAARPEPDGCCCLLLERQRRSAFIDEVLAGNEIKLSSTTR